MTFTEIRQEIMDRLGYTSPTAQTRVGRLINKIYREVGTSIGISFARQTNTSELVSIGNASVTFSEVEKILQVWRLDGSSNPMVLDEVLLPELREAVIPNSDKPTLWALVSTTSNSVTIRLNAVPETAYTLYADVIAEVSDLSGSMEPAFPESFHDVLIEGVLKDEYRKLEKIQLARDSDTTFQRRLSDLRMFMAKSNYLAIQQGKLATDPTRACSSGGGGSISIGSTPFIITALWTFDRDPAAPFAVTSGSAKVDNLDADKLDGLDSTAFARLNFANAGSLLFADATHDIGASGATRPRDLYLSRNAVIGGTETVAGDMAVGSTVLSITANNSVTPSFFVTGSGVSGSAQVTRHTTPGSGGAVMHLAATRGGDANSYTIVQNGDGLGTLYFIGADGNQYISGAQITAVVNGTPGTNDMPTDLVFSTTADGAASPTERMRISSNGLLTLAQGQIKFPGTPNPSSDVNTLDEYEEGTFDSSLGLRFGGAASGMTFSSKHGEYVKIGKLVFATITMTLSAKGTSTGSATIIGMPFTSDTPGDSSLVFGDFDQAGDAQVWVAGILGDASATINLRHRDSASTGMGSMDDTDFGNSTALQAFIVYRAAS